MSQNENLSDEKKFALDVLKIIDDLIKPEIKNSWFDKLWRVVPIYISRILKKKPDKEINDKLLIIYSKLHSKFKHLDLNVGVQVGEKLGSPKIARIGDFEKADSLIKVKNEKIALELLEELRL